MILILASRSDVIWKAKMLLFFQTRNYACDRTASTNISLICISKRYLEPHLEVVYRFGKSLVAVRSNSACIDLLPKRFSQILLLQNLHLAIQTRRETLAANLRKETCSPSSTDLINAPYDRGVSIWKCFQFTIVSIGAGFLALLRHRIPRDLCFAWSVKMKLLLRSTPRTGSLVNNHFTDRCFWSWQQHLYVSSSVSFAFLIPLKAAACPRTPPRSVWKLTPGNGVLQCRICIAFSLRSVVCQRFSLWKKIYEADFFVVYRVKPLQIYPENAAMGSQLLSLRTTPTVAQFWMPITQCMDAPELGTWM